MSKQEKFLLVLLRSLKLSAPITVLIITITVMFYYSNITPHKLNQKKEENLIILLQKKHIVHELRRVVNDLRFLSHMEAFHDLYRDGTKINRTVLKTIEQEFLDKAVVTKDCDQIRFLDLDGEEVIRVNYKNGISKLVPASKLQNKSHRYYYKDNINLSYGEIYLSTFDLNVENNKIDNPIKPIIRLGTPVYTEKGDKLGIIIVNYLGNFMLERFSFLDSFKISSSALLNKDGHWLKSINPVEEWGFMYEGRKQVTFKSKYKDEWGKINSSDSGQFKSSNGMFTFSSIYPQKIFSRVNIQPKGSENHLLLDNLLPEKVDNNQRWIVVSHISHEQLVKRENSWLLWSPFSSTLLIIIFGGGSFALSWGRVTRETLIGRQHELIEEVASKNEDLTISNQKMNKFVGIVSHDIRNPIGRIISFGEILKEEDLDSDELNNIYDVIINAAGEANDLVATVLDIAALKSGHIDMKMADYMISTVVGDSIYDLNFLAKKKKIELVNEVDKSITVKIDSQRISQVVNNLITNAIKFSVRGDKIVIRSKVVENKIEILVEDFGAGILQENIGKLFDKSVAFSTTGTESEKGTGFGLALCQDLIIAHNSTLKVESVLGKGTVFSFELNIVQTK